MTDCGERFYFLCFFKVELMSSKHLQHQPANGKIDGRCSSHRYRNGRWTRMTYLHGLSKGRRCQMNVLEDSQRVSVLARV